MAAQDEEDDSLSDSDLPNPADMDKDGDELANTMPCLNCGKAIYEESEWCPHCGKYVSAEEKPIGKPLWMVLIIIGLILMFLILR